MNILEIGLQQGIERGIEQGIERGMARGIIETCQDLGISQGETLRKLIEKLSLTEEAPVMQPQGFFLPSVSRREKTGRVFRALAKVGAFSYSAHQQLG